MRIYVGNLAYSVGEDELRQMFAPFGQVTSANVITDRDTGQSKGFGFVEMPNATEAQAAIAGLNGKEMGGRAVTVNEARPRADRNEGGRGGSGGGAGGRGGGGGRRW
jgi:RNA recognition motif-containing protein